MKFTRKNQLGWLIALSAATATAQYMIQGAMASGGSPADFDPIFWQIDYGLWGFRALIEAWVIIYCFSTQTKRWWETVGLGLVELALIALIFITLGPALRALTLQRPITEILTDEQLIWWTYSIGGYTSLMMAGAGFAYKIQPYDELLVPATELEASRAAYMAAESQWNTYQAALEKELTDTKINLSQTSGELIQHQGLLDKAQATITTLQSQIKSLGTQLEQATTGFGQDVVDTLRTELTLAQATAQQATESLQQTVQQLEAKSSQLEAAQNLVKSLTARLNNLTGEAV